MPACLRQEPAALAATLPAALRTLALYATPSQRELQLRLQVWSGRREEVHQWIRRGCGCACGAAAFSCSWPLQ